MKILFFLMLNCVSCYVTYPKIFIQNDADLSHIISKKVSIIGYGSQGHAHALNLRDSGVKNICIGLKEGSKSRISAEKDKFPVLEVHEAVKNSDVIMMLAPDSVQQKIYSESIENYIKPNSTLLFAHGFNIHYNFIKPKHNINIGMIAPKGPGHMVRREFISGSGVPVLVSVHKDYTKDCLDLTLSYAKALGGLRNGECILLKGTAFLWIVGFAGGIFLFLLFAEKKQKKTV
jgi:ketol-acid reductoisomerase